MIENKFDKLDMKKTIVLGMSILFFWSCNILERQLPLMKRQHIQKLSQSLITMKALMLLS